MSRRAAVALLLAAVALQLAIAALGIAPLGRALAGDEQTYVAVAEAWGAGEPAELDPLWPPGYPALLAWCFAATGSLAPVLAVQVLVHLLAAGLLGRLALRLIGDPRIAALAATFFALDPQIAAFAQCYWPETLHLALLLALADATVAGVAGRWGALAFAGGLAVALMLKSVLLPLVPVLLVGALLASDRHGRTGRLVIAAVALVAAVAPLAIYNHRQHGFWGLADSTRFNLLLGLTDRSPRSLRDDRGHEVYREYRQGGATFAARQESLDTKIAAEVEARGGLLAALASQVPRQLFRLFDRESYFSAMLPPAGALVAVGQGFRAPPPLLAAVLAACAAGIYAVVLALAPLGLASLLVRQRARVWPLLLLLVYPVAVALCLHVKARYRLLLLPSLDLAAAVGLCALADLRRLGDHRLPRQVWWWGLLGGALLLFFAFGAGSLADG